MLLTNKKLLTIQILVYNALLIVYKENIKIPTYIMPYFVTFFLRKNIPLLSYIQFHIIKWKERKTREVKFAK